MMQDVIVLGAGVAGSVVARRLADSGARVALVGGLSRSGLEGLSERSARLLEEEGLSFDPKPARRTGRWGERRIEGREWLVEREELAQSLRRHARAAGCTLCETFSHTRQLKGLWHTALHPLGGVSAPWLVDARGRRGRALSGPKLLALGFSFRTAERRAAETRIEAFASGWCWWARHEDRLFVQVTRRPRVGPPETWLGDAARELPELAAALAGAQREPGLSARPAHARQASPSVHHTLWRVGDAAWAPDPLSGQGVYEALRSARLVATALASVMGGGELAAARRFVIERQQLAFEHAVRIAAGFYRENGGRGSFWRDTAAEYEHLLPPGRNIDPHLASRPVLIEGRIVLREVLVTSAHPRGIWQVGGVPIAPLLAGATPGVDAPACALEHPPEAVASARRWLKQHLGPQSVGPAFHEESFRADS